MSNDTICHMENPYLQIQGQLDHPPHRPGTLSDGSLDILHVLRLTHHRHGLAALDCQLGQEGLVFNSLTGVR